jgi:hypothetical protein
MLDPSVDSVSVMARIQVYGRTLATWFGRRPGVPPGDLVDLESLERSNRHLGGIVGEHMAPVFQINERKPPAGCIRRGDAGARS